jgi:hypothetical protein
MKQPVIDADRFRLGWRSYMRAGTLGLLMLSGLILSAIATLSGGIALWTHYDHNFTLYLKWQDALVALLWFITFLALGGCALVIRFLYALHAGYRHHMITLVGNSSLTVRDLSPHNLASIFWMLNSAFWCFVAALIGLLPAILIGWTSHLSSLFLAIVLTGLAALLSLVGLVVSIVAISFIIIGCVGAISFARKLGAAQSYKLTTQAVLRIDEFVLTIIYPGTSETMVDLNLLDKEDQRRLLSLLHTRWIDAQQIWNPALGEEIEAARQVADAHNVALV